MSGSKRTEDLQSVKTRALIMQNSDGSFPPVNSVLAFEDSQGHVAPTQNLKVSTLEVSTLDVSELQISKVTASSITAGVGILNKAAITANGDIIANSANMYVTGDQNLTGSIQAEYLTLRDPANANALTYQWVNDNDLLWEDGVSNVMNISQAVKNQYPGPNITTATDLPTCISAVNSLLTLFNNRGIFITTTPPTPPTITFNSPCSIRFNIFSLTDPTVQATSLPIYTAPPSIRLDTLCSQLTVLLYPYAAFTYDSNFRQATLRTADGYSMSISDVGFLGEASRFAAHLNMNIDADVIFTLPVQGDSFVTNPPNNDAPLSAPNVTVGVPDTGSVVLSIVAPPPGPLTPPNALKYYGIYMDGAPVNIISATETSYTLTYTPSETPVQKSVQVYSIDIFNQSTPVSADFTPVPVFIWPPTGFINGYTVNGIATRSTTDFLAFLVPFNKYGPTIANTYNFTIIPQLTLNDICIRINVDDGGTITFPGLQPESSYPGAPPLPTPLVNIPGPQPSAGNGGIYQYSQPITLIKGKHYPVTVTYYNTKNTACVLSISYVLPSVPSGPNPWKPADPGQNFYACPTLDSLSRLNLSQYCFISSTA